LKYSALFSIYEHGDLKLLDLTWKIESLMVKLVKEILILSMTAHGKGI
jgi:hypothetical protein